jgi:hypothetical protein
MSKRERKQLQKFEARLDLVEARIESLRRLETDLRETLADHRERPGQLKITGVGELIALIESVRDVGGGAGGARESVPADTLADVVNAAGEQPSSEQEPRANVADQPSESGVGVAPGAVEARLPPVTEGEIAAWRPDENMRMSEIDLARDPT